MTTSYTSLLGLALPVTGELQGTWGDVVNQQITELLDAAVAGTTTLSVDADVTLSTTTGAANQSRQAILLWTASGTTTRYITAPAQSKAYVVINKTGGTQSIVIRGVGPTTGITVPANIQVLVVWNGTDFVQIASSAAGDVFGPASSTDNAIARFDGTTGKLIQNSGPTIDDDGNMVISVNSSTDALRITQTGTGNALLVEDSANPDSSPFVVDASGKVLIGVTSTSDAQPLQVNSSATFPVQFNAYRNAAAGATINLRHSKTDTIGTQASLIDSDACGAISFAGSDGTAFIEAARIQASVDGTPGTNDMPGRLTFSTTADGASTTTERMRIDNLGNISLSPSGTVSNQRLRLAGNFTQGTLTFGNSFGFVQAGTVQSDVTNLFVAYRSETKTAAASFTLGNYWHFQASQTTIGAASAITAQIGYLAESTLTGATNNFGFYSDIASGTGRWNFYANGTADNYFAGAVGIGAVPTAGITLDIQKAQTGAIAAFTVSARINPDSTVTSAGYGFATFALNSVGASTTDIFHYSANQGTYSGTAPTNQYGFVAQSSLTGATNNYGFYSNIASGTGRWNFYANGTANNAFAGSSSFGATSAPTALVTIAAGTATANTAPIKFTSGTNLTTPEAGVIEYDGTVMTATSNTSFARGTIPITSYTSGIGTSGVTATTNYAIFPSANDTITLPIGTYLVRMAVRIAVAGSTANQVCNLNIRGAGTAVGSFSWRGTGSILDAGAANSFVVAATALGTVITVTATSSANPRQYIFIGQGILKVTTQGTIIPSYQFPGTLTSGTTTLVADNYMTIQQLDSQSAAAFGPAGAGWG